jgi:transketolase
MTPHPSQRGYFAYYLHKAMEQDPDIWVISIDLGYGMLDRIREDFPDRFLNTGASEQAAMGIAVGLAMQGKKPFIYSISTFLIYRAFETIRNYINREEIPVRLVGGGRDKDYEHDGFSHDATDILTALNRCFPNIKLLWPDEKEEVEAMVNQMVGEGRPWFISLRR